MTTRPPRRRVARGDGSVRAPAARQGTQLKPSVAPVPVQAPEAQPAQLTHWPLGHCEFAVHQQGVPDALHVPEGDATPLQLPALQE
jgi:hypothetical protein